MTVTENGKPLKIKFTEESIFKEAGTVNVTIDRESLSLPPEGQAPSTTQLAFQLNQLPEVHSGSFTEEGKVTSEIPPVLALAYALLFLQTFDSETGDPVDTEEARSAFVQRSQLVMIISPAGSAIEVFDPLELLNVQDDHTQITISFFNTGVFNVGFKLKYRRKNAIRETSYLLDNGSQIIPFLTKKLVIESKHYFKMDDSMTQNQPHSRTNTFGHKIQETPDSLSDFPILKNPLPGPDNTSKDLMKAADELRVRSGCCPFRSCWPCRKKNIDYFEN